jgi:hypothetical protein
MSTKESGVMYAIRKSIEESGKGNEDLRSPEGIILPRKYERTSSEF